MEYFLDIERSGYTAYRSLRLRVDTIYPPLAWHCHKFIIIL